MPVTFTKSGKLLGTRQDAAAFAELLVEGVVKAVQSTMEQAAPRLAEEIKTSFEAQKLPEGPFPESYQLDEDYKIQKIKEGLDPRIGVRKGNLKDNIRVYKKSPTRWFVGTRSARKSKKNGYPAREYARRLEFGSKYQKARPIFRPNLRAFVPRYADQAAVNIQKFVKDLVRSI